MDAEAHGRGRRGGRIGSLALLLLLLFSTAGVVPCRAANFAYSIDGQPVLLYKIIQWWYDAPATEVPWICGRTLACRTMDPIQITFSQADRRLTFRFEAGFAELVSAGAPTTGSLLAGAAIVWLNSDYFDAATTEICPRSANTPGRFCLEAVTRDRADGVVAMAAGLEVVLSGPIRGLLDGRIALGDTEGPLKACPPNGAPATASQPVTLTLRQRASDTVLAIFALQPAGVGR